MRQRTMEQRQQVMKLYDQEITLLNERLMSTIPKEKLPTQADKLARERAEMRQKNKKS